MAGKKTLVVYYSRTGTTGKVAEAIARMLQCDLEELVDRKKRLGARGWWVSVRDAMSKKLTAIAEIGKNPADYEMVVIGTPVWAWTMSPAVRTYITQHKERFREVAFFLTTGGTGIDRTFRHMEELSEKEPRAVLGLTAVEVLKGGAESKIKAFVDAVG